MRIPKLPTKTPSYYQIGIIFPDNKKIIKKKCTLNEVFETYFIGLDKYINKDTDTEELLDKYKTSFANKNVKIQINYIDSWGHLWTGKVAWPKKEWFIEYLDKRMNENYS